MRRSFGKGLSISLMLLLALLGPSFPSGAEPLRYGEPFEALLLPPGEGIGGGRTPAGPGTWAGGSRIGTPQVVIRQGGSSVVVRLDVQNPHGSKPHVNVQLDDGTNEHVEVPPGSRVKVRIHDGKLSVEVDGQTAKEIKLPGRAGNDSEVEVTRAPDGTVTVSKNGKKVAEIKEGEEGVIVETKQGKTQVPPEGKGKGGKKDGKGKKKDQDDDGEKGPQESAGAKSMSPSQAARQGLATFSLEGTGSPFSARIRVRKLTDEPLALTVPSGTVLEPSGGAGQSLAVR